MNARGTVPLGCIARQCGNAQQPSRQSAPQRVAQRLNRLLQLHGHLAQSRRRSCLRRACAPAAAAYMRSPPMTITVLRLTAFCGVTSDDVCAAMTAGPAHACVGCMAAQAGAGLSAGRLCEQRQGARRCVTRAGVGGWMCTSRQGAADMCKPGDDSDACAVGVRPG